MANATIDYAVAAQERTLGALRQSQSAVVELVENWAKSVESAAPEVPAIPVPAGLPSAQELVQTTFDYYGKLLSAQREFANDLIEAVSPVLRTQRVELDEVA